MFSCPNCGGGVIFDIPSQQLACSFCHEHFDPYAFESKTSDAEETRAQDGEYEVTIFTCPQCGGEILSTDNAAAGFCSFCGASTILYSRISHEKRPNYIIPFKKTKEDCKQAYMELMKHAVFAPKELKDPKYIDSFRGIYMPYWAFYITQQGPMHLPASASHRRGDYVYTKHYQLQGELDAYYKGLSYDASSSFADSISETLAPYDVKGMKAFTPAFLSGFYADTADVASSVYQPAAEATANEESIKRIRQMPQFAPYNVSGKQIGASLNTRTGQVDSSMFPVWFMSYRRGDRVAYVAVNGQTGKISADIPIAPVKYMIGSLLLALPLFLLFSFFTLRPQILAGITIFLAFVSMLLYSNATTRIRKQDSGTDDRGKLYILQRMNRGQTPALQTGIKAGGAIGYLTSILAIAACALVLILQPVSDMYYYAAVILGLFSTGICIWDIIRHYNILSTRRMPQFEMQGGDDRA